MFAVRPDEIEVEERWYESDPTMRFKIALPFNAETGNKDSAVGYFETQRRFGSLVSSLASWSRPRSSSR